MIKQIGIDNIKGFIHNMNDIQLLLYVDEFRNLKHNEAVYASVLWNDIDQILGFLVLECVERFRDIIVEGDRASGKLPHSLAVEVAAVSAYIT